MSMPNYDPYTDGYFDGPQNPFKDGLLDFDKVVQGARSVRTELLDTLHYYQEGAFETDERTQDNFYSSLGRRALQGNLARFTWRGVDPEIMPCEYIQMPYTPRQGTATAVAVHEIVVRTPVLAGVEFGVYGESSLTPQDVFIEVQYKNGESYKYFFNDNTPQNELIGYDSGRELIFTAAEINDPREDYHRPSVFSLAVPSDMVPHLSIEALHAMIEDSSYNQQPKS